MPRLLRSVTSAVPSNADKVMVPAFAGAMLSRVTSTQKRGAALAKNTDSQRDILLPHLARQAYPRIPFHFGPPLQWRFAPRFAPGPRDSKFNSGALPGSTGP